MRSGSRIVQLNRRTHSIIDETAIVKKFGVSPHSIPDYLSLVGDSADGYSGLPGWGAKSSAAVLAKFLHLERIPKDCGRTDAVASASRSGFEPGVLSAKARIGAPGRRRTV